jgi:hypothetical protein
MKNAIALLIILVLLAIGIAFSSKSSAQQLIVLPLEVACGSLDVIENSVKQAGQVEVLSGSSGSPSTSKAPVIMAMDQDGVYTLYIKNESKNQACIIDYGKMSKSGTQS